MRRNGLAQGLHGRIVADDRFSGNEIPSEAHWCLNTRIFGGEYSAYQLVFVSIIVGLFGWGGKDEDLLSARNAPASGRFT